MSETLNCNSIGTDAGIWLPDIKRTPSPNCDARPDPQDISLLVVHSISLPPNEFGGEAVEAFFQNRLDSTQHPYFAQIADLRVSAHVFIQRNGDAQQFVALEQRAWHAGISSFHGREQCNDFSIGIELEGSDDHAFTEQQYAKLTKITRQAQKRYPMITKDRIVGHNDIAPGRKSDPGPFFKWDYYLTMISTSAARQGERSEGA